MPAADGSPSVPGGPGGPTAERPRDLRRSLLPLAAALVAAIALVAAVALAAQALDQPLGFFTKEPSEVLGARWYTGFLAHVGVLVWWASAIVALSGGALLGRREGFLSAAPLLALGLLSAVFSLDDLFRIHEGFLLLSLGVPKPVTYGVYALAAAGWLVASRNFIRRTEWWLLALAILLLATSVTIDQLGPYPPPHLFEDGTKFLGIVVWTLYVVRTAHELVAPVDKLDRGSAVLDDRVEPWEASRRAAAS